MYCFFIYAKFSYKKSYSMRALHFSVPAGAARALHFSVVAGATAARRAKPGDGRAAK